MNNQIPKTCLNCDYPVKDSHKFCPNCGQQVKFIRLTVNSFINEFVSSLYGLDSKLKRTFIKTLTKPGVVAREFINGKRQQYINPFRFYLGVSIIFFLLTEIETRLNFDYQTNQDVTNQPKNPDKELIQIKLSEQDSLDAIDSIQQNTKCAYEKEQDFQNKSLFIRSFNRFNSASKLASEYPNITHQQILDSIGCKPSNFNNYLVEKGLKASKVFGQNNYYEVGLFLLQKLPLMLFFSLPLYALIFYLFYLSKKLTLAEHMVFTFQYATLVFLILIIIFIFRNLLGFEINNGINMLFVIYLFYRSLRNFYQQSRLKTLVKIALMQFFFFIALFLTLIFIFVISFLLY